MAPSTKLVSSSQVMSRDQLAGLLEGIASRIRDGQVVLSSGPDSVTLDLPEQVTVDVEATTQDKARGTKTQLELEIEWYPEGAAGSSGIELG